MARTHICIYYMNIIFIHLFIYIYIYTLAISICLVSQSHVSYFFLRFIICVSCFMLLVASFHFAREVAPASHAARNGIAAETPGRTFCLWAFRDPILRIFEPLERHGYFLLDVWWRFRHLFHWFGAGPTTQRDSPVSQGCGGNALRPMTFEEPVCIDLFIIIMVS